MYYYLQNPLLNKKGKSPANKIIATSDMIKDLKNGMKYKEFIMKYNVSASVIKRIKREELS